MSFTGFTLDLNRRDYSGIEGEIVDVTVRLLGSTEGKVEIELLLLLTENDLEQHGIDSDINDYAEREYNT